MPDFTAGARIEEIEVIATVIRADGSREDLGTISYWHANPVMRVWRKILELFRH